MCGPGNFAADEGCEVCPQNTYNEIEDKDTACASCPVGTKSFVGAISVDKCYGKEPIH